MEVKVQQHSLNSLPGVCESVESALVRNYA